MSPNRQVSRMLDDEHRAQLDLLGSIEQALGRGSKQLGPELAGRLARHLEQELGRHFEFEERWLFDRMAEAGDADLAELLTEEHDSIREVAEELLPLARAAAGGTLSDADTAAMRLALVELLEREVAHIQKETMALLPVLEDLLDDEADRELAFAYASG